MNNDVILHCEDIYFEYETESGPVKVFEGMSIDIKRGEFVAVLGHNGCGKSTLAKHFNAILLPSGGKVYVKGMDSADESRLYDIRQTVGMVFQNPDNQIVANIVEEDVAFAPENLGVEPAEIRRRVDEALKTVGMYEYREHAPHRLSGGQKQRVAIAGVIAMMPECIVLDEPTAMLDPIGRREVMATIRQLNKERNVTIVLITHHMEEAASCDRVIVMDHGSIITDGKPKEVFVQVELLRSVGLAVPQTVELMYSLRELGVAMPLDALDVDECAMALYQMYNTKSR
ncbi:MAG: energy-coupling factor transporter ATPase [Oscillospiraceae bacterium]|jgi:energy-coupling factor transport system ATP-binding protein|nr:energy-coupling factor transporter ATPase [Oscillospiraceae bacterium]